MSFGPATPIPLALTRHRILLGEDHPVARVGLRQILSTSFREAAIAEAATSTAILEAVDRQDWDLLILDLSLPGRGGLELIPEIKQRQPRLPILVLTFLRTPNLELTLLQAGAAGYVNKDSASDELVSAVQRVLAGGKFFSPDLAVRIAIGSHHEEQKQRPAALSQDETRVVRLLAAGQSIAEIGAVLKLDGRTMAVIRRQILRKLKLRTTRELVHYAIRHELGQGLPDHEGSSAG